LAASASCATISTAQVYADVDITELTPLLSGHALVFLPGSVYFNKTSTRWSVLEAPTPNIAIVPGTENDVAEIVCLPPSPLRNCMFPDLVLVHQVKFANKKNLPFLAYNHMHGSITTLGAMDHGIEIYLGQLSGVTISEDGNTATILGGTNSKLITDTLWEAGKQTVTGTCECVSYMGPALGGGHGWLQGRHGLIADQWTSLNIVLANGTLKTGVSATKDADLFWAVKGAGHNFGIVTSVTAKLYPLEHSNWAVENLYFSGDKVEQVYAAINEHLLQGGEQAVDIIQWSYWINVPALSPTVSTPTTPLHTPLPSSNN